MKKRIMMLATVALVTAAMMVATAMPALAITPYDCRAPRPRSIVEKSSRRCSSNWSSSTRASERAFRRASSKERS